MPSKIFKQYEYIACQGILDGLRVEFGGQIFKSFDEIPWSIVISNTGKGLLVHGNLSIDFHVQCACCLNNVVISINTELNTCYVSQTQILDLSGQDVKILPEDHVIDLLEDIKEAVLIELPFKPLCSVDCKGLCPRCGLNLNENECNCSKDKPKIGKNNPFGVLKDYIFE